MLLGQPEFLSYLRHPADIEQRLVQSLDRAVKNLHRPGADTPGGAVDYATQRQRIIEVVKRLQVGDNILYLGAVVEARAADYLVGNSGLQERLFNNP